MSWYFFYQTKPESDWLTAISGSREQVIEKEKPCFITVLECSSDFASQETMSSEDIAKVHYRGPLYFDFDAADLSEAISDVNRFLDKLKERDVDLECLDIYATGGRGFHIEMPIEVCAVKKPQNGTQWQPYINKEIAFDLAVPTLDLRVYSGKRGRMWRTVNVQRSNGRYKVPVSLAEVRGMTEEGYEQITSNPRPKLARNKPTLSNKLSLMWSRAVDRVREGRSKKKSKVDENLIKKLDGKWSTSMQKVLRCEDVDGTSLGFNKIAMQLAITAHALGKSEDDLVKDAELLCANYQGSDSSRYGSATRREAELRRMYVYMADNPCYTFSAGGIKACLGPSISTPDLTALAAAELGEEEKLEDIIEYCGLISIKNGIFTKTQEGELIRRSDASLINPTALYKQEGTRYVHYGFMCDIYLNGNKHSRGRFWLSDFQSKTAFQKTIAGVTAASVNLSDIQAGYMLDIIRKTTERSKSVALVVRREGLNIIPRSKIPGYGDIAEDVVWVSAFGNRSRNNDQEYEYQGPFGVKKHIYGSDIDQAPSWQNDVDPQDAIDFFENLFKINEPRVVSDILGWFVGAAFAPWFRYVWNKQFPILAIYGPAGGGKSQTCMLFSGLHYYVNPKVKHSASTSRFTLEAPACGSSSLPLICDEYKPADMNNKNAGGFREFLRLCYDATTIKKGNVNKEVGGGNLEVQEESLTAPVCFISEARESDSAIHQRSVEVHMQATHTAESVEAWRYVSDQDRNVEILGPLGKHLISMSMNVDRKQFRSELSRIVKEVENETFPDPASARFDGSDRFIYSVAVIRMALGIFKEALSCVCGNHFDAKLDEAIKNTVVMGGFSDSSDNYRGPSSEMARTLDQLAMISTLDDSAPFRLIQGKHYELLPDCVALNVPRCMEVYFRWCRSTGMQPLYATESVFKVALSKYPGLSRKHNWATKPAVLEGTLGVDVFGLSYDYLASQHVRPFCDV